MFVPVLSLEAVDFVDDFGATTALLVSLAAALGSLLAAALGSLTAAALGSLTGAFAWEAAALAPALVALEVGFCVVLAFLGSDAALLPAGLINRESVLFAGATVLDGLAATGAPFVCELSELEAAGFPA